jgi:DNA polymerase, archaea type
MSYDAILYGKDDTERIVGVCEYGDEGVLVFRRNMDTDRVERKVEPVHPFAWVHKDALPTLGKLPEKTFKSFPLKGNGPYNTLTIFPSFNDLRRIAKEIGEGSDDADAKDFRSGGSPVVQYLMQTGRTLYKGMTLSDVKRMQVDIETFSSTGSMSNSDRIEDEIIIISLCDNRGWERVLHTSEECKGLSLPYVYCDTEEQMLIEFVKEIHRQDPDILELHNGFGFDLPYIRDRAKLRKVNLALGRDNTPPKVRHSKKKFGERDYEYENFAIAGRAVIDTMFLAVDYDVYKRDLPSLKLKEVAIHFNVAPADREYVEGDKISEVWLNEPERLLRYALHDVYETRGIANTLANSQFYLTQMVPFDFQGVHTAGKATIIESLFLREYLRQRAALPEPEKGKQQHGGYTNIFRSGVFDNTIYADVESLYPSIMLQYDVRPESDELNLFSYFLRRLTNLRLESKGWMKKMEKGDPLRAEMDARQSAYKIIINSFYGMLGYQFGTFNDVSEADRVATTGQGLLKRMMQLIVQENGNPVLCDTDGVMFELPSEMSDADANALIKRISDRMPEGINVSNDGRFARVLSYKKKNYILKGWDGKITLKGGAFKSRSIEPFGRQYVKDIALKLLERDTEGARQIHEAVKRRIVYREWGPEDFCKKATLKKTLEQYESDVEEHEHVNRQAQYEIAKRFASDKTVLAGDSVEFYVSGTKAGVKQTDYARARSEWHIGDENTAFYLKRLKKLSEKFKPLFECDDFVTIFNPSVKDDTGELLPDAPKRSVPIKIATVNPLPI